MNRTVFSARRIRGSLRIPCNRPVAYRVIDAVADREATTKTKNLSYGGCMFSAPNFLPTETLLEMKFATPSGVANADASVVFSNREKLNGYQVGVQFVRLLPDARILLEEAVPGLRRPRTRANNHTEVTSQVNHARSQTMKAIRLTHQGDFGSALETFEEQIPKLAMDDETDRLVASFAYSFYGLCLATERHRYAEAVDLCNLSLEADFAHSIHLYNLAMIYLARDDRKRAYEALDAGLSRQPDDRWIHRLIDLFGRRDECVLSFLSRENCINIMLGRLRHCSKRYRRETRSTQNGKLGRSVL